MEFNKHMEEERKKEEAIHLSETNKKLEELSSIKISSEPIKPTSDFSFGDSSSSSFENQDFSDEDLPF